jgi:hypothetical protein
MSKQIKTKTKNKEKEKKKKKRITMIFSGSIEIEVDEGYEREQISEFYHCFNEDDIELTFMGYFENKKCDASIKFSATPKEGDAIYGNNL